VNVLDENIIDSQRQRLRQWRIAVRQVGHEVGRPGMKDQEIITLLHGLRRPTFFTRDDDYFAPRLCHSRYCLAYLAVAKDEVALFVRRFLRHQDFETVAKRMGVVVRLSQVGMVVWRGDVKHAVHIAWDKPPERSGVTTTIDKPG
jgi:hypothetical protein